MSIEEDAISCDLIHIQFSEVTRIALGGMLTVRREVGINSPEHQLSQKYYDQRPMVSLTGEEVL